MQKQIENIVFDLGGVILNLDYERTRQAFNALQISDFDALYSQAQQTDLFDRFEKGECSTPYFINALLNFLPTGTTPNKVVAAWNAMILDFPLEKLNQLEALQKNYRLFLLSNTNDIHLQAVNRSLEKVSAKKLPDFFEKAYYSHEIKQRKPHAEVFSWVCSENGILPENTLFIDDTAQHILGAKSIGMHTYHIPSNLPWDGFLAEFELIL